VDLELDGDVHSEAAVDFGIDGEVWPRATVGVETEMGV